MATPTAADIRAAQRYGPLVGRLARQYRNPYTGQPLSGEALLLKVASGESGFNSAASSGKAQGRTQFTPGSRQVAIQRFGVDPLANIDSAYHATALHLLGKINGSNGLAGYNPGDPGYTDYILKQKVGSTGGTVSPAGGGSSLAAPGAPADPSATLALIDSLSQPSRPAGTSYLQAPAFSAHAALPQGYQAPMSGGGPQAPQVDTSALLSALAAGGQGQGLSATGQALTGQQALGVNAGSRRGRVVLDPRADRPGAHTQQDVINFVRSVSSVAGMPLRIGTGTNHSRLTVDGNVSDHWTGQAADIPASGRRNVQIGQAALVAAGMSPAEARKQTGGLYNVGRFQVIFSTTEGGNHFTHVHVGVRR